MNPLGAGYADSSSIAGTPAAPLSLEEQAARRLRWRLVALVALSLAFGMFVVAFRGGLAATAYTATDSAGRTMGFNDRFSLEHYGIILRNCSFADTRKFVGPYEWVFIAFHALAIGLLLGQRTDRWLCRFFLVQPLIFPLGVLGLPLLLMLPIDIAFLRTGDRESVVDIPFIWFVAHAFWVLTAVVSAWRLRRFQKHRARHLVGAA